LPLTLSLKWQGAGGSTDALIYGSDEQIVSNKIKDEELLLLSHKVQQLNK